MNLATRWTRRTFLANASFTAAAMAASLSSSAGAAEAEERTAKPLLTCIASSHLLEAFVVRGREKRLIATLRSDEPFGAIALHPTRNVVYAAYDTAEYLGLPGASIAAFVLEESSRRFALLSRRALALSATHPRHVSISPDAKTVLVCATGGGAYNSFEADADGSLVGPTHALKLAGCGPHALQRSAQPVFSAFGRCGRYAYACDFGSDRVDQITFVDGVPSIRSRALLPPGSGPVSLAMHPSEEAIAVVSALRPGVTILRVDGASGRLGEGSQGFVLDADFPQREPTGAMRASRAL